MNSPMIRNLLSPLSYLRIKHEQKPFADWTLPSVFSIISILLICWTRGQYPTDIHEEGGILSKILAFTQNLPGFYIAALAAIATFNKNGIDQVMPEPAPKIETFRQNRRVTIDLTRRSFLCMMFAFLTTESIAITVAIIFWQTLYPPIKTITTTYPGAFFSMIYTSGTLFMFWQMIITTMWGLYYLGDRIHRNDE